MLTIYPIKNTILALTWFISLNNFNDTWATSFSHSISYSVSTPFVAHGKFETSAMWKKSRTKTSCRMMQIDWDWIKLHQYINRRDMNSGVK